ncbi:hypothetical protein [Faecalibaculum rodentium]|uniref:hypothetical protein n=1 Tax=Faecalibaculum rodentium TaxID=1702221 RepID=UPI00259395C7|nr:hypothetical protein [Faecalibaculum rodentium]
MKKLFITAGLALAFLLAGCGNSDPLGTQYYFGWAQIKLPNGEIVEGEVDAWNHGDENDRVRVTIDGIDYNTHFSNVCLFSEKPAD